MQPVPCAPRSAVELPEAPPAPTNFPPRSDSPEARALASSWFAAFGRGDVAAMLGPAVYPFRSSSGNAAGKRSTLETMLRGLVEESDADARTVSSMQIVSPAGLRGMPDTGQLVAALRRLRRA